MLTLEIERGAGRLRYAVSGRNHGQPLLLLHPLGADLEVWRQQLPELEQRFRVVRMDLRGHGGSALAEGAPAPCAMTDLLDDACAVLDAQGIARAHWCGLSLGGAVALQAAVTAPQRVRRLVLADTAASFPPRERWDERIATVLAHGIWLDDADLVRLRETGAQVAFCPSFQVGRSPRRAFFCTSAISSSFMPAK